MILVTGASGSLGSALRARLPQALATDRDTMDVRDAAAVAGAFSEVRPTLVYHLAGAKHAPEGELDPWEVAETNVMGTRNVLLAAEAVGARVVTASTCKAADPETAYGASKLLAERLTLAAGQSVARFYNVVETCGNVFELWRGLPGDEPIPVTPCTRYFISSGQAVELLLAVAELPAGRYTVDPGAPREMRDVACELYPWRQTVGLAPRRGDRLVEPRCAVSEWLEPVGNGIERIVCAHDRRSVTPAVLGACHDSSSTSAPTWSGDPERGLRAFGAAA